MRIVSDLFLYPIIKFFILRDTLSNILGNTLSNILGNSLSAILSVILIVILSITLSITLSAILSITLGIMISDMPHYENIDFDVPSSWEIITLSEVFFMHAGKSISAADISPEPNEEYRYLCVGGNGKRGYVSSYNTVGAHPIIGRQGALCGNVNYTDGQVYATEHAVVVDTFCETEAWWAYYFLKQLNLNQYATATAQPGLSVNTIGDVQIPLPPYEEQVRIVAAIEQWYSLIDALETAKEDLQTSIEYTKSKILDLAIHGKLVPQDPNDEPAIELLKRINPSFVPCDNAHYENVPFEIPKSWRWTCMAEVNEYNSASVDPSKSPNNDFELYSVPAYETGMPEFVKGKDISSSKKSVSKNDVLLCKINPHLNRAWIVSHYKENMPCLASSEWIIFRNSSIIPQYLSFCFTSKYFKELMLSNVSGVGGSLMRAQPAIVNKYLFPLPPINEQCRIVAAIQEYYEILDNMSANL